MFGALAKVVVGPGRWAVFVVWLALAVVFVPIGGGIGDETQNDTESLLPADAESGEVSRRLKAKFESGETMVALLVYRARADEPLTAAQRAAITEDARLAAKIPRVVAKDVRAPFGENPEEGLISQDGRTAFTVAPISLLERKKVPDTAELLRELGDHPGLDYYVTGPAILEADFASSLEKGDATLLIASVLLVVTLLLAIYRSPIMAAIPLVVVVISYVVALGLLTLLARNGLRVDSTSTSLLLVLMFGAGTDYCLLYVARYSQALRANETAAQATRETLARTGPAILASGLTVALALIAMVSAKLQSTQILGPVNSLGVVFVLAASLTLLPAILALLGRRAFWPLQERVAYAPDAPTVEQKEGRWTRAGRAVIQRPKRVLVASIAILAVSCVGVTVYAGMSNPVDLLRSDQDSVKGFEVLRASFPAGLLAPTTILVQRRDAEVSSADLGVARAAVRGVGGSTEIADSVDRSRDRRLATFSVFFDEDPYGDSAFDRIERMRSAVKDLGRPGVTALVGDSTAQQVDYGNGASRDNTVVIPLVLLVIALVLTVLLRALVAPLFLILTVVLSYGATMGISVLFFSEVLDQNIDPVVPTFSFIFLVALGVDYNIFLMSRVREEALEHGTRAGLLRALGATGPVITSAGIVLAGTFSVLMTIPVTPLFQIGFAVSLGVLIDTFVVRTLLVPAITSLLGERTWLPGKATGDRARGAPLVSSIYRQPVVPLHVQWRAPDPETTDDRGSDR